MRRYVWSGGGVGGARCEVPGGSGSRTRQFDGPADHQKTEACNKLLLATNNNKVRVFWEYLLLQTLWMTS